MDVACYSFCLRSKLDFGETRARLARVSSGHQKGCGVFLLSRRRASAPLRLPSNYADLETRQSLSYVQDGLEAWVVDPRKEEVKVHRRGQSPRTASLKQNRQICSEWCAKPIPPGENFRVTTLLTQRFLLGVLNRQARRLSRRFCYFLSIPQCPLFLRFEPKGCQAWPVFTVRNGMMGPTRGRGNWRVVS